MKAADIANILLGMEMLDSLFARAQSMFAGMKQALAEDRDLTDQELQTFRDADDAEDARLEAAIEKKRQSEFLRGAGADDLAESDKITGDKGGDIRP